MLHRQQNLLHAGHSRGRGCVPDVALDGAHGAEVLPGGLFLEYGPKSFHLDRIAQFGSRAVGLYITDRVGIDLMLGINLPLELDLAVDARRRDSVRSAILV